MMPLYQWIIHIADDQFNIQSLGLVEVNQATFISLSVIFKHLVLIYGQQGDVLSTPSLNASLLAQNLLHPFLIYSFLILMWSVERVFICIIRFVTGLPLMFIVLLVDAPLQLLGKVYASMSNQLDSPWATASPLIYWSDFLNGGGSFALGGISAVVAVAVSSKAKTK
jgi:hypothetical protein